jgi:hypothetical protein
MKYQYLDAEALSVSILPINWEYTFEAVSNPSADWIYVWRIFPSRVAGITTTLVFTLF